MRVFWALIGVLVLVTAGVLVSNRAGASGGEGSVAQVSDEAAESGGASAERMTRQAEPAERPDAPVSEAAEAAADRDAAQGKAQEGADAALDLDAALGIEPETEAERELAFEQEATPSGDAPAESAPASEGVADADDAEPAAGETGMADASEEEPDGASLDGAPAEVVVEETIASEAGEAEEVEVANEDAAEVNEAEAPAEEVVAEAAPAKSESETAEAGEGAMAFLPPPAPEKPEKSANVVEREDGSLLVADRYVVRGEGTRQKPYELGMDLLVSMQDDYNPREGQTELPGWVKRFDGTFVKVTGNMLFPLWADSTDELLLMKNEWDGCCVGVPPSPYDAVEVKLGEAVDLSTLPATFGPVVGRFKVEPYIRSNWLLGLYVMEDARLE